MADFLNTEETSRAIRKVVKNAKEFLVLVSPYIHINERLKNEIFNKELEVLVVFGKQKMKYEEYMFLIKCENVSIFYNEDLHAKCYINEETCILSSMNLYEYSEINNIEMSVIMDSSEKMYKKAFKEIIYIIENSEQKKITKYMKKIIASI